MNQSGINNLNDDQNNFPRKLSDLENKYILSVLPANKPGYNVYREKISELDVIGLGRFGKGDLILGERGTVPDSIGPPSSVFAAGIIKYDNFEIDIIVHEEFENQIEAEIYSSDSEQDVNNAKFVSQWNYSDWVPGQKAPGDNSFVREEILVPDKYIIAVAPVRKRIWIHDFDSGINHLIPVSNFYNHLMMVKGIKNSEAVLKPSLLFEKLDTYTANEIVSAFLLYNKYLKHIDIDYSFFYGNQKNNEKKKKLKLFKKGQNIDNR